MEEEKAVITHAVHTGFPGRIPDESMWFESEEEAQEHYDFLKNETIQNHELTQDVVVIEIHSKRYEVTWGDKGAGYAVWIEDVEPQTNH
jgi:hypothetical protein